MTRRTGSADLPLHGGRVPAWLGERMSRLGAVIAQAVIHHYGRDEFLRRLAHPFWFQSFGAVMGMDWHSSGITTSVMGALRRGLEPLENELGLYICGGKGRHSRRTPDQLLSVADRTGLNGTALAQTSRLVAKVDSAAVQDGFDLYLHSFIVAEDGAWVVVQQGMNDATGYARRYHWLSENMQDFLDDPHNAIDGKPAGNIINLADRRASAARGAQLDLLRDLGAEGITREVGLIRGTKTQDSQPMLPHLVMPAHHEIRAGDVMMRRLHGALAAAAERGVEDFQNLLMVPGVGARTVEALALVAEVVHGTPCRFADPARFAMAHGGKDGHPFPVPTEVYDRTIALLKAAVTSARLGNDEQLAALRRLDGESRRLERTASGPSLAEFTRKERAASHGYGGRSVFGWAPSPAPVETRKNVRRPARLVLKS